MPDPSPLRPEESEEARLEREREEAGVCLDCGGALGSCYFGAGTGDGRKFCCTPCWHKRWPDDRRAWGLFQYIEALDKAEIRLRSERRDAMERACRAVCAYCAGKAPRVTAKPEFIDQSADGWYHALDRQVRKRADIACVAAAIRREMGE